MILEPVFLYCERTGPGLLVEPFNLVCSLAYLVSAAFIWRMSGGLRLLNKLAVLMVLLCGASLYVHLMPSYFAIGFPIVLIVLIVLTYFYSMNRDMLRLSHRMALACSLLILPFVAASLLLMGLLPGPGGSMAFMPLLILLLGYAGVLRTEHPDVARGLLRSALILGAALFARVMDFQLCGVWPHGTQFLWKILTAILIWHLARIYRAHMLAGGGRGR